MAQPGGIDAFQTLVVIAHLVNESGGGNEAVKHSNFVALRPYPNAGKSALAGNFNDRLETAAFFPGKRENPLPADLYLFLPLEFLD